MEYRQHGVPGRSDSNDNLNSIFNNPYDDSGNHNDNTGTLVNKGGELNDADGDGDCNENGGTQGGADNYYGPGDQNNEFSTSIPTSVTPSSTKYLTIESQASNTPTASVTAVADSPTLTMSATTPSS